jgi:hypothetical protein
MTDVSEVHTDSIIRAMIAVSTSEISVYLYGTTEHNTSQGCHFNTRRRVTLKSCNLERHEIVCSNPSFFDIFLFL